MARGLFIEYRVVVCSERIDKKELVMMHGRERAEREEDGEEENGRREGREGRKESPVGVPISPLNRPSGAGKVEQPLNN